MLILQCINYQSNTCFGKLIRAAACQTSDLWIDVAFFEWFCAQLFQVWLPTVPHAACGPHVAWPTPNIVWCLVGIAPFESAPCPHSPDNDNNIHG